MRRCLLFKGGRNHLDVERDEKANIVKKVYNTLEDLVLKQLHEPCYPFIEIMA